MNEREIQKGKICEVPGCEHSARCKGLCINHYNFYKYKEKELKNERDERLREIQRRLETDGSSSLS